MPPDPDRDRTFRTRYRPIHLPPNVKPVSTLQVANHFVRQSISSRMAEPPPPTTGERYRKFFGDPVVAAFVAGGVAGAVSRTVVSPLERLKILYQVQNVGRNEYKLPVHKALVKMWREEGFRGFMAGNGTNCIRIIPYSATQFGAYNFYKRVSATTLSQTLLDHPISRSCYRPTLRSVLLGNC